MRLLSALCFAFVAFGCHAESLDEYIHSTMADQRIPGLAFAIIKNGEPVEIRTYGLANVEHNSPVTEKTAFRLASISKQIVKTAVLMLVEDGKLKLDDQFCNYIENCPDSWSDVEIHHLLTHTSGMRRHSPAIDIYRNQTNLELIEGAFEVEPKSAPGESFLYSNFGYAMLGEVITRASGKKWDDFIAEELFVPLGMESTRPAHHEAVIPHRAGGYRFTSGRLIRERPMMTVRPAGGFISTISDMVKWDAAVSKFTLITQESRDQMWTPAVLSDGTTIQYAFGVWSDEIAGVRRIRHGGSNTGFRTWYSRYIDYDLSIVLWANSWGTRAHSIARDIAGFYIDDLRIKRGRLELTSESLQKFVGRYRLDEERVMAVGLDGGGLSLQWGDGQAQEKLVAETANSFYVSRDETVVFNVDDGATTSLTVYVGEEKVLEMDRIE